jgi:osmoprotectant transport system substrate-binding protein
MLEDNKHYFPPYEAVPIVRNDTLARYPEVRTALLELSGKINDAEMRKMNYEVDGERRDIAEVAREFLRSKGLE